MNNGPSTSESFPAHGQGNGTLESLDAYAPELAALREARKRAFDGRVAAENALREAAEAEAELLRQEEQALAAAAARREQLAEAARTASIREREALDWVAEVESQFRQSAEAKEQAQAEINDAIRARDEAQHTLERLNDTLAEVQDRLRIAEASEGDALAELATARRRAEHATSVRERAGLSSLPSPQPEIATVAAMPLEADTSPVTVAPAHTDTLMQRVAERRAADALRAGTG